MAICFSIVYNMHRFLVWKRMDLSDILYTSDPCEGKSVQLLKEVRIMDSKETEKKEPQEKEDCKPLTDEEFKAYQEKDKRTEKKVKGILSAIWEAINFFS